MEYNAVLHGVLHSFEEKPRKKGNGTYFAITIRNMETFTELKMNCYDNLNLEGIGQGQKVQVLLKLEPDGYKLDARIVAIKKAA